MKLLEALDIVRRPMNHSAPTKTVFLACGFTPLHLQTFLTAELRLLFPGNRVEVATGLFGDLVGNVERLNGSSLEALAVVVEWSDVDPRLGIRVLGGWPADLTEVLRCAEASASRLQHTLSEFSRIAPIVVSMPTIPLPPMFSTTTFQAGVHETELHRIVASLAASLSRNPSIRVVNPQLLGRLSPLHGRYDPKSDVGSGFPYALQHASTVGRLLAELIHNRAPMKGLITDLDDTLWAGVLGEDGVDGISWHLDHRTHQHGLYQQFLASLASAGVLIAAASKNELELVETGLARNDLLLSRKDIFPVEAHWSRKSESVRRILKAWNIGAESVIFIDDNPMEVAEVKANFPGMDCRLFPKGDDSAVFELLNSLRDAFGKKTITSEDALRLESIRIASERKKDEMATNLGTDEFLRLAEAAIVFDVGAVDDKRAFELINKTNQFNLNGKRLSEAQWRHLFHDPTSFLLLVTYKDKYGPLGKIATIVGRKIGSTVTVEYWVMSCRAFSRRIEHQCLNYLFESLAAERIDFAYEETPRNGPLREFLAEQLEVEPLRGASLTRDQFAKRVPPLFHRVEVLTRV